MMSNEAYNQYILAGSPEGEDLDLYEIADWAGYEIEKLRAENERLMALITDAAQSLAPLIRMPNAEHFADIHNAAVERIRKAALLQMVDG
jgi:hypothetical protein